MRISILFLALVAAHGDHTFDLNDQDEGMSYAERHVSMQYAKLM